MARIKRSPAEWRRLIYECENSGETVKEWCASHGINLNTYRNSVSWFRKMDDVGQLSAKKQKRRSIKQNWTEVITGISAEAETNTAATLMVEAGPLRITAYAGYPAEALAEIIGRLMKQC